MSGWEVRHFVLEVVLPVFSAFGLVLALTGLFWLLSLLIFTLVVLIELS